MLENSTCEAKIGLSRFGWYLSLYDFVFVAKGELWKTDIISENKNLNRQLMPPWSAIICLKH